jgi:Tfp pilus assembly PilM family ATPase
MKHNNLIGIDIGNYQLKVSLTKKGILEGFFSIPLPENLVKNSMIHFWEPMASFLRESLAQNNIRIKNAVFSVPLSALYIRTVELPLMTIRQLELNLPFEFHDYISDDSSEYYYDYAVIERNDKSMKLLTVACSKKLIQQYKQLAKAARLRIVGLLPDVVGLQRVIQRYDELYNLQGKKDYAILDMGDHAYSIHFFRHGCYEITRNLEPGASEIVSLIAEITEKERHVARIKAEENQDAILEHPRLITYYENRAVEIMRVLNFYSYSNAGNTIDTLYYCGGGSCYEKQLETIARTLTLPMRPITDLMEYGQKEEYLKQAILSPLSFGLALDPELDIAPVAEEAPKYEGIYSDQTHYANSVYPDENAEDIDYEENQFDSLDLSGIQIDTTPDPLTLLRQQDAESADSLGNGPEQNEEDTL